MIPTKLLTYAQAPFSEIEKFRVEKTDLIQSIAYAGRRLHADPNDAREKWLLLFTDLEDTEGKDAPLNLKGVHVRVFFVPTRGELSALDKKVADWSKRFQQAGAASGDRRLSLPAAAGRVHHSAGSPQPGAGLCSSNPLRTVRASVNTRHQASG